MSFYDKDLRAGGLTALPAVLQTIPNCPLPAAMSIEQAQAYSGFSRKHLDQLIRIGKLDRARVGPNGAYIVRRDQLDAAIADAFSDGPGSLERDFRFA